MSLNEDSAKPTTELDLKQLFDKYYARLVYFSSQIIGCRETAEDVVQEAFVSYWNQRTSVAQHPLAIKSFLYSTVKHASLNITRHQKVKENYAEGMVNMTAVEDSLDHAIIHAEVLAQLHNALSTLPAKCQRISRMCYFEGMRNHEVAKELGISVNTVKTQKQRALQLLRLKLNPELYALLFILEL